MAKFSIAPLAKLGTGFEPQFAPGGKYLLVHQNSASAKLFSVGDWELIGKFDGAPMPRLAVFGPKNETVTIATFYSPVVRFALPSCKKLNRWLIKGTAEPNGFALHAASDVLFHSCPGKHIDCLSIGAGKVVERVRVGSEFSHCHGLTISSDNRYLIGAAKTSMFDSLMELVIWNLPDRTFEFRLPIDGETSLYGSFGPVVAVPQSELVAVACHNRYFAFVNLRTRKIVRRVDGIGQEDLARMNLTFSPCGRWAAIGDDGRIRIFDPTLTRLYSSIETPDNRNYGLSFSPDGRYLAASTLATYVWEVSQLVPATPSKPKPKAPSRKKTSMKRGKSK